MASAESILKESLPCYSHVSFDNLAALSEALGTDQLLLEAFF
jgi:hypothetical protein